MREIKFRQPVTKGGIFVDWHYWGYVNNDLGFFTTPLSSNDGEIKQSYQFTGLHDKNGKEIYEKDIIDFENGYITEIIWKDNGFRLDDNSVHSDLSHGVIIGSIYENPTLLTN